MAELTRTTAISNLRQKAAPLIEEARRMAQDRRPVSAGSIYRDAAAIMQKGFERLPRAFDRGGEVTDLVREIVQVRVDSAQSYGKLKDHQEASYQLSFAAKCLENFAVEFDQPEREEAADLLAEALKFRRDAISFSREEGVSALHLAFQLSYASRTMMFLCDLPHEGDPATEIDQMVSWRREAGLIFQRKEEFRHAYFEYYYLCGLLYKKRAKSPAEIDERAGVSLLSAEMAEAGKLETFRLVRAYRIALKDYQLAGNQEMAQKIAAKMSTFSSLL